MMLRWLVFCRACGYVSRQRTRRTARQFAKYHRDRTHWTAAVTSAYEVLKVKRA